MASGRLLAMLSLFFIAVWVVYFVAALAWLLRYQERHSR